MEKPFIFKRGAMAYKEKRKKGRVLSKERSRLCRGGDQKRQGHPIVKKERGGPFSKEGGKVLKEKRL